VPEGYSVKQLRYGPYSPSRLIAAKCPQRFFGQYIRKDKNIGHSQAAARGNAIHLVLSKITAALIKKEELTPQFVNDWVAEAIAEYPAAYESIDLVKGAADAYVAKPNPYMNESTSCECAFAVQLVEEQTFLDDVVPARGYVLVDYADANGIPNRAAFFGGKLDQVTVDEVTHTITIIDHKSTPSTAANSDHNFQVACYAWLASLYWPGWKIRTVLHYAHPKLSFYAPPVYWNEDDLREIEAYIHGRIMAIEGFEEFPAIPNNNCDYCHLPQECAINLKLSEQLARGGVDLNVRGVEDLKRLATALHPLEVLCSQMKGALKKGIETYAPENGISIPGVWYGNKPGSEAVDWLATDQNIREKSARARQMLTDPTRLTEEELALYKRQAELPNLTTILEKHGIKPDTFKKWEGDKLKAIWKLDRPELLSLIKEYVITDKSTRFGGYKQ
jgi:CRISPR/Cas system-associated exonuclease Cas4 (RecB family)